MYYSLVIVAVIMFGVQFYLNNAYQKESGTSFGAVLVFNFIIGITGIVAFTLISRFKLSFTPFALIMAAAAALNGILCSICSLKALSIVNLSFYSLFSMLGGMLLPLIAGVFFFKEELTVGLIICSVLVITALFLTIEGDKSLKKGMIYYIGVFVCNGMAGVILTMYNRLPFAKVPSSNYYFWLSAVTVAVSLIGILAFSKTLKKPSFKGVVLAVGGGLMNRVANLLLLIALSALPASVQYSFVTGGVMIVSTLLAAITNQKPSRREVVSVALSFIGILALVFIKKTVF